MSIQLPPNSSGTVVDTVTLAAKDREIIVLGGDGAAAEVVGVAATAPASTEYGQVTRPILRQRAETLSTATLGISGVFSQSFQDGAAEGVAWIEASARADVASASAGFIIEQSDDSADANFTVTAVSADVGANTTVSISAAITKRYWRVKYTNGGTGQASFRLTLNTQSIVPANFYTADYATNANDSAPQSMVGIALPGATGPVAGGTSTTPLSIVNRNAAGAEIFTSGDHGVVNVAAINGATPAMNSGVVGAGVQRVTLATDVALPAGTNNIGDVDVLSIAAGDNNIGNVDVVSLPALAAGTNNIGDVDVLSSALPTGASTLVEQQSQTTSLQKLDNIAHSGGDVALVEHVPISGQFDDTGTGTVTENNIAPVRITSGRALHVAQQNAIPAGTNNIGDVDVLTLPALAAGTNNIGDVDVLSMPTGASSAAVQGTVAHDSAAAQNPVRIGLKAKSSLEGVTLVAADDVTDAYGDLDGAQLVRPQCPLGDIISERVSDTAGTSAAFSTFGAPGAGVRNYVTAIVVHNSHATTDGFLDLRDGTAGSVLMTVPLPHTGGAVITLPVPLRQPTANTALAYDVSAAITTVYISLIGFQSKL